MDAGQRFEALLASGKDGALLRFSLGMHYLGTGEPARAAGHLRRAVEQDPDYSAAWKLLGKALAQAGDPAGAVLNRDPEAETRDPQPKRSHHGKK